LVIPVANNYLLDHADASWHVFLDPRRQGVLSKKRIHGWRKYYMVKYWRHRTINLDPGFKMTIIISEMGIIQHRKLYFISSIMRSFAKSTSHGGFCKKLVIKWTCFVKTLQ
jgi:hypothetical protein